MSILHFERKATSALSGQRTHHTEVERQRRVHPSATTFQARKDGLLGEIHDFLLRQDILAKDLEHRISIGLQLIADLSASLGRTATAETAERLTIAAGLVAALERLSSQLRFLRQKKAVEMKQYLQLRYEELHDLSTEPQISSTIVLVAAALEKATTSSENLGSCLEEFVTNSVTYVDLTGLFDQRNDSFSVDTN